MELIPRYARKIPQRPDAMVESEAQSIEIFRDKSAWVLLGEPGMGKTTAFQEEAKATNGEYLRIVDFLEDDPSDWKNKTLYLDGLDEIRGDGNAGNILQRIRQRLKSLGNPPFRIACRAADWYGSTDRNDLESASPNGQIDALILEPLSDKDILTILGKNHGVSEPQQFVEKARQNGVYELLDNPETLRLLATAIQGDQWPKSRNEIYQLACEKLATEENKRHRDRNRKNPNNVEKILDAAGQLCVVMLLSNKTGLALDRGGASEQFPTLNDYSPSDSESASLAIHSKLFRPNSEKEERFEPSHRTIAEYLASRWIAQQIDKNGLPLKRIFNLLLGRDGRTVAGLRGLYGWLALHCIDARTQLIENDPLTIIAYGDVKPMPAADKLRILEGLGRGAKKSTAFLGDIQLNHSFGALSDAALYERFSAILEAPERDAASQAFIRCVVAILLQGEPDDRFASMLQNLVRDETRWPAIRQHALQAWLKITAESQVKIALLEEIHEKRVVDRDDDLAGILLQHLYPKHLAPTKVLRYFHRLKDPNLNSYYLHFWSYELVPSAPVEHLAILLDGLVGRIEFISDPLHRRLNRFVDKLLVRGLLEDGDNNRSEQLYEWLGIGHDEHGQCEREQTEYEEIKNWLSDRPAIYKSLMAICFNRCAISKNLRSCMYIQLERLHGAEPPKDIGCWHLEQASLIDDAKLAHLHLEYAVAALIDQKGAAGLSLEMLESWSETHPDRQLWLPPLLSCEISEAQLKGTVNKLERQRKNTENRRTRTIEITRYLSAIRSGTAPAAIMDELAGVWMNRISDIFGTAVENRFSEYSENGHELLVATEIGFKSCLNREDLPTTDEIIAIKFEQQKHYISLPCLIGMDLCWQEDPTEIQRLSPEILNRMIAFYLTHTHDHTSDWFTHLIQHNPELIADVLYSYASTALKAKKEYRTYINCIYPLEQDSNYRAVALLVVPRLLKSFPVRTTADQLSYLESLLKAALRYMPEIIKSLVADKIAKKGMDKAQKVYWYAAATFADPAKYEDAMWNHIGSSETLAIYLAEFLGDHHGIINHELLLPVKTLGKTIELLAPSAEIEWGHNGSIMTDAMFRGDQVRSMITHLGATSSTEAELEIKRLQALPTLKKLKHLLDNAHYEMQHRQRESEFHFLSSQEVAQVLANKAPTTNADLTALVLDTLDDIAMNIRQDNDDGFRNFWNVENKKPTSQREENLCRDVLLTRLRLRLSPHGIDCQPEMDCSNDKRADIKASYQAQFELPIEIKRDSNEALWTGLRKQLIEQYSISPLAKGYGIYLVLWFGGSGTPGPIDGGKKPRSADELQFRLEAQLDQIEQTRIFVRVLDVSWPI